MPKITLDLTGIWEFKEYPLSARRMRDLGPADWLQTPVPCSIFNSLIRAGRINRRDIDTHPENFSWVSEKPWVFRKIFDLPPEILNCDRLDLIFDGLDTIASIWLNDKLIARTNNMFIPYRFDVTKLLKRHNNTLLVKFDPAVAHATRLMNRYGSINKSDFSEPARVYIRKAQYQFGWDFCPSLPGCGIWQPLRIEAITKAALESVHIRTIDCNHRYADLKFDVKLDAVINSDFTCELILSHKDLTISYNLTFEPGEDFQSTVIRIENPALWWPRGYGDPALYNLDLQLLCNNQIIDRAQQHFGIRTVKLNCTDEQTSGSQKKDSQKFQLEINGRRIFAKGANWLPASIFAGSITEQDYTQLLNAAQKANFNMLRVWGGGYYETNPFYELCDRLGIMVWQDFMFACAYYPDRKWFLENVKTEAAYVIKRLRNHPCLVLWCGNNEIDHMHNSGQLGRGRKFYGREIYHKLLPELVTALDQDNDYIPTTPLRTADSGQRIADRKRKLNAKRRTLYATEHQWQVWSGHQPVRQYFRSSKNIPPFVTEFGLQSLPNIETVKKFCPPDNLHIAGQILENHNYQLDGNSRLYRYMGDLFGAAKNLSHFAYLSQLTQARAVKAYVEHLRAHNSKNSGVLFWQFNDCSPAITWSAIDYTKQPKALYYYARRFFSPLLIAIIPESEPLRPGSSPKYKSISIIVINDSSQPITAILNCRLIDLFGRLLDRITSPIVIGPFSTSSKLKLPGAFVSPANPHKSALHLVLEREGENIADNLFLYLPDKYIEWPDMKITKRLSGINDTQWKLTLNANAVAKDLLIQSHGAETPAQFSDNFIDLIPPYQARITIDTAKPSSAPPQINLTHLRTTSNEQ